jgi:hypothetical protein
VDELRRRLVTVDGDAREVAASAAQREVEPGYFLGSRRLLLGPGPVLVATRTTTRGQRGRQRMGLRLAEAVLVRVHKVQRWQRRARLGAISRSHDGSSNDGLSWTVMEKTDKRATKP